MQRIRVRVKPWLGKYVIEVGNSLYPKMFDTKGKAMEVAKQINKTHNG